MLNKLKYILMMIILTATLQVAGQDYIIDEVCVGAEREYRVEGESGSTYEWQLTDASGNIVALSNPSGTNFTDGTTTGSATTITWNNPGNYYLSTIQTSAALCDTMQQGIVRVYEQPTVSIVPQQPICPGNLVYLAADATNTISLLWETTGDGTFSDVNSKSSIYTPGTNDLAIGNTTLTLTGEGMGKGSTCTPAVASIEISLIKTEDLISEIDTTVCISNLPFDWYSNTVTSDGPYEEHFTSFLGL